MKTLMTDWLVSAASLVLVAPLLACDAKSTEIGATVGEETSGGETETSEGATDSDTTGTETESSGENAPNCAAALDATACGAVEQNNDISCFWVDVRISDSECGTDEPAGGRCISSQYYGDGCTVTYSCVDDTSVFTRDLGDGTYEWFTGSSPCGWGVLEFDECVYDESDAEPCGCLCEGLGSGTTACDPLGEPCPNTQGASQECEPTADGESWACVPQFAGTSPTYGDECWPEDSPSVACTGETICLPADGLGVAGCDGGEGGGCCTQLCDLTLGAGNPCPDEDQLCRPFYGDQQPPEGYEHVGVCQL